MDLTEDCAHKIMQDKRTLDDTASCVESIKKMKFHCSTGSVVARERKENVNCEMSLGSTMNEQPVEYKTSPLDLPVTVLREILRNEETALLLLRKLRRSQLSSAVRSGPFLVVSNKGQSHVNNHYIRNDVAVASQPDTAGYSVSRQQYTNSVTPPTSTVGLNQHIDAWQHHQVQACSCLPVTNATTLKESSVRPQPAAEVQKTHEKTLAQRRALAKLAIRRQLETTLLQLPKPKFTPQEMSLIPTLDFYADFVALIGMEEAIACILNEEATSELAKEAHSLQPSKCVRCQTDFTPQWKPEEQGAKSVICELCASKSQKQTFRDEHTARIKAAFYVAHQQERQVDIGSAL